MRGQSFKARILNNILYNYLLFFLWKSQECSLRAFGTGTLCVCENFLGLVGVAVWLGLTAGKVQIQA